MVERIFLSYNHRDTDLARRIAAEFQRAGLAAMDPDTQIAQGASWRTAVRAALDQSAALVVVLGSPFKAGEGWLTYEIGMAEASNKPVIVMSPDTHSISDLPADFLNSNIHTFDPRQPEAAARAVAHEILSAA